MPNLKGIEWWIHVREAKAGMFAHFDRDEGHWANSSPDTPAHFPLLSSVLFLSSIGQPLLIIEQRSNDLCTQLIPTRASNGFVITPKKNTLVVFPGSLLHGVQIDPNYQEDSNVTSLFDYDYDSSMNVCETHRVTLLFNFWCTELEDPTCICSSSITDSVLLSQLQNRYGVPLPQHLFQSLLADDTKFTNSIQWLPSIGAEINSLFSFDLSAYRDRGGAC